MEKGGEGDKDTHPRIDPYASTVPSPKINEGGRERKNRIE